MSRNQTGLGPWVEHTLWPDPVPTSKEAVWADSGTLEQKQYRQVSCKMWVTVTSSFCLNVIIIKTSDIYVSYCVCVCFFSEGYECIWLKNFTQYSTRFLQLLKDKSNDNNVSTSNVCSCINMSINPGDVLLVIAFYPVWRCWERSRVILSVWGPAADQRGSSTGQSMPTNWMHPTQMDRDQHEYCTTPQWEIAIIHFYYVYGQIHPSVI